MSNKASSAQAPFPAAEGRLLTCLAHLIPVGGDHADSSPPLLANAPGTP